MTSDPGALARGGVKSKCQYRRRFKYCHRFTLSMHDVADSRVYGIHGPEISRTAMTRPSAPIPVLDPGFVQRPAAMCFHSRHDLLRFEWRSNNRMNMVGANMRPQQRPTAPRTQSVQASHDDFATNRIQDVRVLLHSSPAQPFAAFIRFREWTAELVQVTRDRSCLARQPDSIASPCNQEGRRSHHEEYLA